MICFVLLVLPRLASPRLASTHLASPHCLALPSLLTLVLAGGWVLIVSPLAVVDAITLPLLRDAHPVVALDVGRGTAPGGI